MHYFDHETTANSDEKIMLLRLSCGGAAVDAYWVLLELIYDDEKPLKIFDNPLKTQSVCHRLNVGFELFEKWVLTMLEIGLFERVENDESSITSERAMANIAKYQRKAEIARENGKKGGRKPKRKTQQKPSGLPNRNPAECNLVATKTKTKGFGFDKQNQKPLEDSAASAAKAAALPQGWTVTGFICKRCSSHEWRSSEGKMLCPNCDRDALAELEVIE